MILKAPTKKPHKRPFELRQRAVRKADMNAPIKSIASTPGVQMLSGVLVYTIRAAKISRRTKEITYDMMLNLTPFNITRKIPVPEPDDTEIISDTANPSE